MDKEIWYLYTVEFFSAFKIVNTIIYKTCIIYKILRRVSTMLKMSKTKKDKCSIISYVKKKKLNS